MPPSAPLDVPADVELDPELVHRLITEQHPAFAADVQAFSEGWDNAVFRVGERWLARMPRRAVGAANLQREQAWIPALPDLPVAIPVPVRCGVPGQGYPYPWSIVPWFEGAMVGTSTIPPEDLLAFLLALHRPCPPGVPSVASRSMPLIERWPLVERCQGLVEPEHLPRLLQVWEHAVAAPPHQGNPQWVHGDLHPFNLLASEGRLSAVIDWGDLFGGDPAPDLAAIWMLFEPAQHGPFIEAIDADRWQRGRGWAVYFALALLDGARRGASPAFGVVGKMTIRRLMSATISG